MYTGKTKLAEVLDQNDEIKNIFAEYNMFCEGCPGAVNGTLEEAAEAHDVRLEELLEKLNREK